MRAQRVHRFGPPEVIVLEDLELPVPGAGEVLVRVVAAGVGPWDGWIRAGRSVLPLPLADARAAHEMLEGARPRPHGKIVLQVA